MTHDLRYGTDLSLRISPPPRKVLADFTANIGRPLDDPAAAVAAAVSDPLDFPPLARATVPGDRIVLAVDRGVPQVGAVVAGIVNTLLDGAAEPADIAIVQPDDKEGDCIESVTAQLPMPVRRAIQLHAHDPCDRNALAYLAASKDGDPIYFNRTICEADVVIPVGSMRLNESFGYNGVYSGLFPAFSDEATKQRFSKPSAVLRENQRQRRRDEAAEAAWLLGIQFTVQIIPGHGDSVLHVLAGDADCVARRGDALCQAAWRHRVPRRAGLVIATIEGGPDHQTWENLARAIFASLRVITDHGTIVLCTDLKRPPGPALKRLAQVADSDRVLSQLQSAHTPDAAPASLLLETRERCRVFLLSGLDGDVVEELGVGHVAQAQDIERLAHEHDSCILLANAHHAMPVAADE